MRLNNAAIENEANVLHLKKSEIKLINMNSS